jgi:predicted dehydrogenase
LGNERADVQLVGIVDPYVKASAEYDRILESNVPLYETMEQFYSESSADLAVIGTPIFLHCEQSVTALKHGSYVMCEKPVAPTVEDAEAMLRAEEEYGRWIAIGYQWSFSEPIQKIKQDIISGKLGKPISLKCAISWPRGLDYYSRGSGWAGRISKDGVMMLDSIASNACAHYIHNMLFLLGESMDTSAEIDDISGVCLRANNIESFDTCTLKMTVGDAQLYIAASHAAENERWPEFVYKFENGTLNYTEDESGEVVAMMADGSTTSYGILPKHTKAKVWVCVNAIREGTRPICTVKTALPHTRVIKSIFEKIATKDFPREVIAFDEKRNRMYVKGLYEKMYQAYENESMLEY